MGACSRAELARRRPLSGCYRWGRPLQGLVMVEGPCALAPLCPTPAQPLHAPAHPCTPLHAASAHVWQDEDKDWRRVRGTKSVVISAPHSKRAPRAQSTAAPRPQCKGAPRAGQAVSRAAANGEADGWPLSATNAVRRLVLIPAEMWPDDACDENGGTGCRAAV